MIKRFKKNNPYTLCLIMCDDGDVYTWCVNVTYIEKRVDNVLYFVGDGWLYLVNTENMKVHRTLINDDYSGKKDIGITNIVKGWQW